MSKMIDKVKTVVGIVSAVENWPAYLFDYVSPKGEAIYSFPGGIRLFVRSPGGDKGIVNEIFVHKEYTHEIGENDIIVDIGAHIGAFSVVAGKKASKGKVFSYEPEPSNFQQLKKNVELNNLQNVSIFNMGVLGSKGTKEFYSSNQHTGGSSVLKVPGKKISASFTTIEDIFQENGLEKIDYLKMDVEGAEYDILMKTPSACLAKIAYLALETHNWMTELKSRDMKAFLEKEGFAVSEKGNMMYAARD